MTGRHLSGQFVMPVFLPQRQKKAEITCAIQKIELFLQIKHATFTHHI